MKKRKPFDIEAAQRRIEELESMPETDWEEIRKLRYKIFAEEDRQAQDFYNDPESIARDEAMKQSNKEAMDRWRAEHGNETCVADPYK